MSVILNSVAFCATDQIQLSFYWVFPDRFTPLDRDDIYNDKVFVDSNIWLCALIETQQKEDQFKHEMAKKRIH